MKSPTAICNALEDAGVRVDTTGGKPRLVGGKPSPELVAAVKDQRDAVLAEWDRREKAPRGWRALPRRMPLGHVAGPRELPDMCDALLKRTVLFEYCHRQGHQVRVWLEMRAREYWNEYARGDADSMIACEFTACLELVSWQQRCTWVEALDKVQGLDEAYRDTGKEARP